MKTNTLASFLIAKYKFADNSIALEHSVRKQVDNLWNYPNKLFPILRLCAESSAGKAKNPHEKKAVVGYKFCKKLLDDIEVLKNNSRNFGLGEIRELLLKISNSINDNKDLNFGPEGKISNKPSSDLVSIQFPHVSALIFEMFPIHKRNDIKLRNDLQAKARTGLSRILSLSNSILDDIKQLEVMSPEKFTHESKVDINQDNPNRFIPQRGALSTHDIIDFIRNHGDEYGLSSREDWVTVFEHDPVLKEKITTVINAINRGHSPVDGFDAKKEIQNILQQHKDLQSTNAHLFEEIE